MQFAEIVKKFEVVFEKQIERFMQWYESIKNGEKNFFAEIEKAIEVICNAILRYLQTVYLMDIFSGNLLRRSTSTLPVLNSPPSWKKPSSSPSLNSSAT